MREALRGLGQRMLGALKKQGRKTRTDSVVVLACKGLHRAGRQHPKQIVCARRGTEQQEEPRGLQITDSRETAEQLFLGRAFAAELTARESCTPQRCAQHQQPLLVSGHANRLEAGKVAGFLTCRIPYAGLALVQADARMAPQRVFQGPVQFPGAFRCRHDVRVVQSWQRLLHLLGVRLRLRSKPACCARE